MELVMTGLAMRRHCAGVRALIELRQTRKCDAESFDRCSGYLGGSADDRTRIDAAAQKGADWNIGDHVRGYRSAEMRLEIAARRLEGHCRLGINRKVPVPPLFDAAPA